MNFRQPVTTILFLVMALFMAMGKVSAQVPGSPDEQKGFKLYEKFEGSSNSFGQVTKLNTTAGYNFNKYFGVDVGVPIFFVRSASTSTTTGTSSTNDVGDAYMALRLTVNNPLVNFASTLTGTAPTGDTGGGLSTGRATYDWSNRFERDFGPLTPFAEVGLANTVLDTHYFHRPFSSLGFISHYEAGTDWNLWRFLSVGASAYDVLPSGQQKIYSRIVKRGMSGLPGPSRHGRVFENNSATIGSADIARDNGFSGWIHAKLSSYMDFELGYSRSVHYRLDTVSFGVGVNVGRLLKRAQPL